MKKTDTLLPANNNGVLEHSQVALRLQRPLFTQNLTSWWMCFQNKLYYNVGSRLAHT